MLRSVNTILRPYRALWISILFSDGRMPIADIFRPFRADLALKGRNIIAQGNRPVKMDTPDNPKSPERAQ